MVWEHFSKTLSLIQLLCLCFLGYKRVPGSVVSTFSSQSVAGRKIPAYVCYRPNLKCGRNGFYYSTLQIAH